MQPPSPPNADARRQLTLLDATCIMVGVVVGSGIFGTPKAVAEVSPNLWAFFGIWIAGGIASLLGAMCYAELSTRYPEDGGNYAYLNRAFGSWAGFLYAWTDFWIVRPANAGAVAFVLGDYAQAALPLGDHGVLIYAVTAVALSTLLLRSFHRPGPPPDGTRRVDVIFRALPKAG
jgi:amino acid transporter